MKINRLVASLCAAAMLVTAVPSYAETPIAIVAPVSVEYEAREDGTTVVAEHYLVKANADVDSMVKDDLEYNGQHYRMSSITRESVPGDTSSKEVTVTRDKQVDTDDVDAVLKVFPDTLPYNSDGYTGTVYLDTDSLVIAKQTSDTGAIETVAFIQLSGPNTDEDEGDDSNAVSAPRYLATVHYAGTVECHMPDMLAVTMRYIPVKDTATDATKGADVAKERLNEILPYILGIIITAFLLWLLCAVISHHRKQKAVEADDDNEYDEGEAIEPAVVTVPNQAKVPQMYRPAFLANLERGGDDTLGDD